MIIKNKKKSKLKYKYKEQFLIIYYEPFAYKQILCILRVNPYVLSGVPRLGIALAYMLKPTSTHTARI